MIEIKDLKKNYKDFALDVSMEIPTGTVTGIVGQNGAGKSTTIKSIIGLVKRDSGSIKVFDKDIDSITVSDREQFGVALSDSSFCFEFNLEDVIKILKNMYHSFDEGFFRRICEEQNLPMKKKLKEFSTGMKAKVRVLTALSHSAKLLILDEPTAGLDVMARNEVLDILRKYLEEDPERSVLISSHISSDLESICDDIYFIDRGHIILHEDTDTILGKYGILKVNDADYASLDKRYLICSKKETFGYICLAKEKQFYIDNNPGIIIENGSIDDMIVLILSSNQKIAD